MADFHYFTLGGNPMNPDKIKITREILDPRGKAVIGQPQKVLTQHLLLDKNEVEVKDVMACKETRAQFYVVGTHLKPVSPAIARLNNHLVINKSFENLSVINLADKDNYLLEIPETENEGYSENQTYLEKDLDNVPLLPGYDLRSLTTAELENVSSGSGSGSVSVNSNLDSGLKKTTFLSPAIGVDESIWCKGKNTFASVSASSYGRLQVNSGYASSWGCVLALFSVLTIAVFSEKSKDLSFNKKDPIINDPIIKDPMIGDEMIGDEMIGDDRFFDLY